MKPPSRGFRGAVVLGVATAACAFAPPALAAPAQDNCAPPGQVVRGVPWPQQMLGPQRVWQFSRGGGVRVAVLDSGVDANHPQLRGHVEPGFDAVAGSGTADSDCLGTGTQVAGVIAAQQAGEVGFVGMAPGARILPIRVIADQRSGPVADPGVLARGVNAAVDRGAHVIAVSTITYTDSPALRDAIANAVGHGVIVVAAVGDRGDTDDGNPPPYPASYPDVIGVGAVAQSTSRWPGSQHGEYVDLVAPGADVVTLQRAGGLTPATGTGVACGFVAAVAAMVRAKRGSGVTPAQVAQALYASAIPLAGGPSYGHGLVNPYSAVNDQVARSSAPLPALVRPSHRASSSWAHSRQVAIAGTLVAVVVVIAVLVLAVALPRGRRRFWRSGLAPAPPQTGEPDEPGPPVLLFDEQR